MSAASLANTKAGKNFVQDILNIHTAHQRVKRANRSCAALRLRKSLWDRDQGIKSVVGLVQRVFKQRVPSTSCGFQSVSQPQYLPLYQLENTSICDSIRFRDAKHRLTPEMASLLSSSKSRLGPQDDIPGLGSHIWCRGRLRSGIPASPRQLHAFTAHGQFRSVRHGPRVSRRPAVSRRVTGTPARSIRTSITSRVVPAYSEVIAASRPAKSVQKCGLPDIGRHQIIATSNRSRTRSATLPHRRFRGPGSSRVLDNSVLALRARRRPGLLRQRKSMVASIRAAARIRSTAPAVRPCCQDRPKEPARPAVSGLRFPRRSDRQGLLLGPGQGGRFPGRGE